MKVEVPATTANIGPGFDVLGICLSLSNTYELVDGQAIRPTLADRAYRRYYEYIGKEVPNKHIHIVEARIPSSSGLGSSASLIVGGLVLANESEKHLDDLSLLMLAKELEGHADNVAPAIFGGLVLSADRSGQVLFKRYDLDPELYFVCFVPDYTLSTAEVRKVLPDTVSRREAIENVANTTMLTASLITKDYNELSHFFADNFHEPYRKRFIKHYDRLKSLASLDDVIGVYLSGAGPTMIALTQNPSVVIDYAHSRLNFAGTILSLTADNQGYEVK
ncbi:MAG TPA: homoserine kinase [Clostridiaceae bacterium]|nr:homoserine kinase [Clostridiaceae bacterium]